jgi:S-adenosylmethionine/arginine decarboxylase-like enzyme
LEALGVNEKEVKGELVVSREYLLNLGKLFNLFLEAIGATKAKIMSITITPFPEHAGYIAYSIMAILAESHALLETIPEQNKIKYVISTCGTQADPEKFKSYLYEMLIRRE